MVCVYVCARMCVCVHCISLMKVYLCVWCLVEVMSEMAGRHVEAIETWSGGEHGRCVQMVVVSPWLLRVT